MGNRTRAVVGFAVALGLIGLFVYSVGFEDVADALGETDGVSVALGTAAVFGSFAFRGMVWVRLLRAVGHGVGTARIYAVYLACTSVKFVTPYGQVSALPLMTYVLVSYSDADYDDGFASVVSIDITSYPVPLVTFGVLSFVYFVVAGPATDLGGYPVAFAILLLVITVPLFFVMFARATVERLAVFVAGVAARVVEALARLAERVADFLVPGFVEGTAEGTLGFLAEENIRDRIAGFYATLDSVVENRNNLGVAVVYAHAAWFLLALPLYFILPAFGESAGIGVVVFIVALSRLGVLVPLPGGLGTVDILLAGIISLVTGLSLPAATAAALVYRLLTYWLPVFVGAVSLVYLLVATDRI